MPTPTLTILNEFRDRYLPMELQCIADFIHDAPRKGKMWTKYNYEGPRGAIYGWKGPFMDGYGIEDTIRLAANRARRKGSLFVAKGPKGDDITGDELYDMARDWLRDRARQCELDYRRMYAVKGRGPGEGLAYWRKYRAEDIPASYDTTREWTEDNGAHFWIDSFDVVNDTRFAGIDYTLDLKTHERDGSGWKLVFDDSDFSRHDHKAWIGNYLLDQISDVLSPAERENIRSVLVNTVQDVITGWRAKPLQPTERHRMHYPVLTLLSYYRWAKKRVKDGASLDALERGVEIDEAMRNDAHEFGDPDADVSVATEDQLEKMGWARGRGGFTNQMRLWSLAEEALAAAEAAFQWAFLAREKIEWGPHGDEFRVWDMGEPSDSGWDSLNNVRSDWPWYIGFWAQAMYYLCLEPDVRSYIKTHVLFVFSERAKWIDEYAKLPRANLEADGSGPEIVNALMHGAKMPDDSGKRWIRPGDNPLDGQAYFEMDEETYFHPGTFVIVHTTDREGYQQQWWPTGSNGTQPNSMLREHYPRSRVPIGPKLEYTGGAWAPMIDFLLCAFVLTGKVDHLLRALMICENYFDFHHLMFSGETLLKRKRDRAKKWYGTAAGVSRALYWLLDGSSLTKQFVFDNPLMVVGLIRDVGEQGFESEDANALRAIFRPE